MKILTFFLSYTQQTGINEIIEAILDSETSWQLLFGHDLTFDSKFIICEAADEFASLVNRQIGLFDKENSNLNRYSFLIFQLFNFFRTI